jgi:hypothetical protein
MILESGIMHLLNKRRNMSTENIEAHLQTSHHMKKLSGIVESTIDTQLSLSKRLARVENELRVSQRAGVLLIGAVVICLLIIQYQI